jgi:hypothetical protein
MDTPTAQQDNRTTDGHTHKLPTTHTHTPQHGHTHTPTHPRTGLALYPRTGLALHPHTKRNRSNQTDCIKRIAPTPTHPQAKRLSPRTRTRNRYDRAVGAWVRGCVGPWSRRGLEWFASRRLGWCRHACPASDTPTPIGHRLPTVDHERGCVLG